MNLKPALAFTLVVVILLSFTTAGFAHFGMVIPSDNMVAPEDRREITLNISFSHPFEGIGMKMVKPEAVYLVKDGEKTDMVTGLKPASVMEHPAWQLTYKIKRPGAHAFVVEPAAYWEPAEDCYIVHYTKTIVSAFGDDTGWDEEIGLKTEIVPLTRPLGLYAGNLFQGVVKLDGKAVPYAEVEVEFYNKALQAEAPSEEMITQVVKADQNGVFSYSVPAAGWWGFAALNTSDKKMVHDGEKKDIELGAVIWVKFENWQEK
ncbi:MAG: DUF4198 domain-containing protein [Desulfobacterales bacterium]|nr:DUF4198 domain-containing protein [Desulfobacterales bacterium]